MTDFGAFIKTKRETLARNDRSFSQRQLSKRIGIEPSYLSKIERGIPASLSEEKIVLLAQELDVDADYLLALGGKISSDVQEIIKSRPELFAKLVRGMKNMPDEAIGVDAEFQSIMSSLNSLHDLASIGAFRFSEHSENSFWTEQTPTILGIPTDEAPTLDALLSAFPSEEKDAVRQAINTARKTGDPVRIESRIEDTDGHERHLSLWAYIEQDPDTNSADTLGIIQDVTESTVLRNEISSVQEALQLKVTEQAQTVAAAVRDLKNENERRKQLEQRLTELNTQISRRAQLQNQYFKEHAFQIRTLASYINLEGLRSSNKGYDPAHIISRIIHKINNLGDFLQIEEGFVSDEELFGVHASIDSIVESFSSHMSQAGIDLHVSRDPALPEIIQADRVRIEQIINSLLELVVQMTQWGAAHFSVRIPDTNPSSLMLSLYIPSAKHPLQKKHFYPSTSEDRFMGLENPVQTLGPLLDELGGSVSVSSPSETEAAVQIHIPVTIPETRPEVHDSEHRSVGGEGKTILVVEDDPYNQLFIQKGLSLKGYEVELAKTGATGLTKAAETPFHAILLDIQLPDLDGTRIAKTIRSGAGPNANTPIIAVTAHATPSERRQFKVFGIDEVVAKPFELEELAQKIQNVAGQPKAVDS